MVARRRNEIIIGILFLVAMLTYGIGNGIIERMLQAPDPLDLLRQNRIQFAMGALLMITNSMAVSMIGILFLPILSGFDRLTAFGYLITRVLEAVLLLIGILSLLLLIPLSWESFKWDVLQSTPFAIMTDILARANFFAYQIAMILLGFGSLFLCYGLYRTRWVPRWLAVWGALGYIMLASGALTEILGLGGGLAMSLIGGLFEIILPVWLFTKGLRKDTVMENSPEQ
ncbi:MAG: DUF4386 domain-containing protein [Saprospiraceae bacterium]|nr:DUF4386 domain-containing protein [Saprospiraceae bacterium]